MTPSGSPSRSADRRLPRASRRHDLAVLTHGAIAGALALGGFVAALPLRSAAAAYKVVRAQVMDDTTGFPDEIGYHLSQMFYPVLPHLQDDLSLMRAVRNDQLEPLYAGMARTADAFLLISAAGFTYLALLYGRVLFRRRRAAPSAGGDSTRAVPVRTHIARGMVATALSPVFFHALRGLMSLIEQFRVWSDYSWSRVGAFLRAVGADMLSDLQTRWHYTVYAALVGAAIYVILRLTRATGRS